MLTMYKCIVLLTVVFLVEICIAQNLPLQHTHLSEKERVLDLIDRLTLDEKIKLLSYDNKGGVQRLGIPAYNWWNEALHGVGRAGRATVFPQTIAMSATFNQALINKVAIAISSEARAKYNEAQKINHSAQYMGLTFWSPNINIFRDPRWGRGQETWGEDPYLTGELASAFVKGMQEQTEGYYKTIACAKHFAVHSGPEPFRHGFNANVSKLDLHYTYLPAFKKLVTNAKVGSVMCAYNALHGEPCCLNKYLLDTVLRQQWHFEGYVVTDCWALSDVVDYHKYVHSEAKAAALAIKTNVNVECGSSMATLKQAIDEKLVTEKEINKALEANLATMIKLGMLDKKGKTVFAKYNQATVASPKHIQLARTTAAESMVLLVNKNNTLPLSKNIKSVFVTGPTANDIDVMLANYNGFSSNVVTYLEGIIHTVSAGTQVQYNKGCNLVGEPNNNVPWEAEFAETIIAVVGLTPSMEGENGDASLSKAGGDKIDINFPKNQVVFLKNLKEKYPQKKLIVLVTGGSAIVLQEIVAVADAVLLCWYSGEQGGNAAADIIFGNTNPSGRLPITFYDSNDDLPAFDDYSMQQRTYRYMSKQPKFNFGFGLSYSTFQLKQVKKISPHNSQYVWQGSVANKSPINGQTVVQLYAKPKTPKSGEPNIRLIDFQKLQIKANSSVVFTFKVPYGKLTIYDEAQNDELICDVKDYDFLITENGKDFVQLGNK
jgi:beta-glucosidase